MINGFVGFNNGYEFVRDLVWEYGIKKGIEIANSYLDMQAHNVDFNKDPDEFTFCRETYAATKFYMEEK